MISKNQLYLKHPPLSPESWLTLHALAWLCAACGVGILLSLFLLAPGLNETLAPFSYGRWIPVHLNGQLYGWCFLPLIGLLFRFLPSSPEQDGWRRRTVDAWSIALGVGCLSWLAGQSSGKLFMEWSGLARVTLPAAMLFLAAVLLVSILRECRETPRRRLPLALLLKILLWICLLPVPFIMYWASSPTLFPPVNPDSGGATGGDLLISSLGAITIIWLCPFLLQMHFQRGTRMLKLYLLLQVIHYLAFAAMDHGDQSNYRPAEIIGLLSLLIWLPVLIIHFRSFNWPAAARPWLWAFACWAAFLVLTANIMFLPGLLDVWKFTHMVVGHTHTAMAGMLSAFNLLVLISLHANNPGWMKVLGDRRLFWFWNLGTLAHVLSLKGLGMLEGASVGALFYDTTAVNGFFWLRLAAGILMFWVATAWLRGGLMLFRSNEESSHA